MKTAQKKPISILIAGSLLFLTVFLISVLKTNTIFAQANTVNQKQISLTAIPPRLGEDNSLKALPGEKLQVQLRVRNLSDQTVDVVTTAKDFILAEDGETPLAIDDSVSNR